MQIIAHCPYCHTAAQNATYVVQTDAWCKCRATHMTAAQDGNLHITVFAPVDDVPSLPAEERAARSNIAELVDRIDKLHMRVWELEALQSGPVLAQRLAEYLRTVTP